MRRVLRCTSSPSSAHLRTTYDGPALAESRKREASAKENLERLQSDENAGEFDLFTAKKDLERSGVEGIPEAEFKRVLFLNLVQRKSEGAAAVNEGTSEEPLHVPSLSCSYSCPTDLMEEENGEADNVQPGSHVAAEARLGDHVLLSSLNKNKTKGMGAGLEVDSMLLLQSRAEKQFFGKAVHKDVARRKKESEKMSWCKILDLSPLKHSVCVSHVPTASDPSLKKWLGIGVLSNSWIFRQEEGKKGGTLWR